MIYFQINDEDIEKKFVEFLKLFPSKDSQDIYGDCKLKICKKDGFTEDLKDVLDRGD